MAGTRGSNKARNQLRQTASGEVKNAKWLDTNKAKARKAAKVARNARKKNRK